MQPGNFAILNAYNQHYPTFQEIHVPHRNEVNVEYLLQQAYADIDDQISASHLEQS
jgi:hypothetical protein